MNFRWRRRLSSIQLILGDTRRAPGPSERARKKAVREHNTLNQRIDVREANAGHPSARRSMVQAATSVITLPRWQGFVRRRGREPAGQVPCWRPPTITAIRRNTIATAVISTRAGR
jgi:hypothetical protein